MNLGEVLRDAAAGFEDVDASQGAGEQHWSCSGQMFAVLAADGGSAEFLLDSAVAAAATRTRDTTASVRGSGWIRFSPDELDVHAVDRATAWFASARRRQARN